MYSCILIIFTVKNNKLYWNIYISVFALSVAPILYSWNEMQWLYICHCIWNSMEIVRITTILIFCCLLCYRWQLVSLQKKNRQIELINVSYCIAAQLTDYLTYGAHYIQSIFTQQICFGKCEMEKKNKLNEQSALTSRCRDNWSTTKITPNIFYRCTFTALNISESLVAVSVFEFQARTTSTMTITTTRTKYNCTSAKRQ